MFFAIKINFCSTFENHRSPKRTGTVLKVNWLPSCVMFYDQIEINQYRLYFVSNQSRF